MSSVNKNKSLTKYKFWYWSIEEQYPSGIAGQPVSMVPVDIDADENSVPSTQEQNRHVGISRRCREVNKQVFFPRRCPRG